MRSIGLLLLAALTTMCPIAAVAQSASERLFDLDRDPEPGLIRFVQGEGELHIPIEQGRFEQGLPNFDDQSFDRLMRLLEADVSVGSAPVDPLPAMKFDLNAILINAGALDPIYDRGFVGRLGVAIPLSDGAMEMPWWEPAWAPTPTPYLVGGCQVQNWGSKGVNVNGPGVNLMPDGDLTGVGGYLGGGIEWTRPWSNNIDVFFNVESTVGVGHLHQGLRSAPFNPALPIVGISNNSPETSAAYVNGVFQAAVGIGGPNASLAFSLAYQIQRTELIFGRWHSTDSLVIGMQGSVTTDLLRNMVNRRRRRGREATPDRTYFNSRLID